VKVSCPFLVRLDSVDVQILEFYAFCMWSHEHPLNEGKEAAAAKVNIKYCKFVEFHSMEW